MGLTGWELGVAMVCGGLGGASLGAWISVHLNRRKRAPRSLAARKARLRAKGQEARIAVETCARAHYLREAAARLAEDWGKPVHLECQGPCAWRPVPGWLLEEARYTTYVLERVIPAGVPLDLAAAHEARALGCLKCDSPVRYGDVVFPRAWSGKDA